MERTGTDVGPLIAAATPAIRRRDAEELTALLQEVTGRDAAAWGSIVGFGSCHYRYPTGNEGDMPVLAFAPRKAASTIYLDSTERHADALARLGPHTVGKGCVYVKDLDGVDLGILEEVVRRSYATLTDDPGFGRRLSGPSAQEPS